MELMSSTATPGLPLQIQDSIEAIQRHTRIELRSSIAKQQDEVQAIDFHTKIELKPPMTTAGLSSGHPPPHQDGIQPIICHTWKE